MTKLNTAALACITLLTAACDDRDAPLERGRARTTQSAAPAHDARSDAAPALTSAAPSAPRSILDAHEPKPALAAEEKPLTTTPEDALAEPPVEHAAAGEVRLDRFVLTSGVEAREPLDDSDLFGSDHAGIYAFLQLANEEGGPTQVFVHFEKDDGPELPYGIALELPTAKRWRTWAVTRVAREPGRYRAVVRTADGEELARRVFEIVD